MKKRTCKPFYGKREQRAEQFAASLSRLAAGKPAAQAKPLLDKAVETRKAVAKRINAKRKAAA